MRKLRFRFISIILCALMLLGAFTACNGSEKETESLTESESFIRTETVTEMKTEMKTETVTEKITETATESKAETATETETELDSTSELGIELGDSFATVTTPMGLVYSVSGYESVGEDGFSCSEALVFKFDDRFNDYFNRFTIDYVSDSAVKIFVKYMQDDGMLDDCFFLESGKGSFSALVLNFLNKADGCRLEEIRVEPLENENARFAILGLTTEMTDVPEKTYYLEGNRYTLGLDLSWGGAISYLSDNKCPVDKLTNLINRHDAGRLVQQSYYGTGAIEGVFEWGSFNKNDKWPYNPVQGGDRGAVKSRIVDFVVEDNCVYIKAQPMDWGKVGYITPSYMENWYVVEDDFVRVDNRFVDFSGWEHPYNSQELPAFYTVSYLDSFVWYDGIDSWTGDELSYRHDLNFWGNSENANSTSVRLKAGATEIWSAWVNVNDDYGIGLFAPGADRLAMGRYQYNASKSGDANPTNYTAPSKQIKLVSFEALEYSYMLTTGSVEEIRATFTEYKDFTDNASLSNNSISNRRPYFEESLEVMDLTKSGSEKYILYPNKTEISYDDDERAIKLVAVDVDPHVSIDYLASSVELFAKDYSMIEIEYMIPETNGKVSYSAQLFLCAGMRVNAAESDSVKVNLIKDGEYHTLKIRLSDLKFWTGRINTIRFDYFNSVVSGDVIYLRSFALTDGVLAESLREIHFDEEASLDLLSYTSYTAAAFDGVQKALRLTSEGNDPYVTVDYGASGESLSADKYNTVRLEYMIPVSENSNNYKLDLFFMTDDMKSFSGEAMIRQGLIADGEYHVLDISMSDRSLWAGIVKRLRIDYFAENYDCKNFYLKSITLVKK